MSTRRTLRIATRQSRLALWQANFVRDRLLEHHPGLHVELVGMTTQGDRWLQSPLSAIGGKGLFVKELEIAMLEGRADLAVHSVKDLPADTPDGFSIPVIAFRAAVEDVLISRGGPLAELPPGARVGSSSLRRKAQLLAHRSDLDIRPIRGNVETRLRKLADGEFDAIVLARAGLDRLELEPAGMHVLSVEQCLPAAGQGALGIECVAGSDVEGLLEPLADRSTARCVGAERGVSQRLGADCSMPVAAYATADASGSITLRTLLAKEDGTEILTARAAGDDPDAVAAAAVARLRERGADAILATLRSV